MLALQTRGKHSCVPPPPQKLLVSLAELRNKVALPEIRPRHGLRIPPEEQCLLNPNYQLQPTERGPVIPLTLVDPTAKQARQQSNYNIHKSHTVYVDTPAAGWQPGPDPPGEAWPGSDMEQF